MAVLDLVVENAEVKNKEEWVSRIRKINGQKDPNKKLTPEEEKAEQDNAHKQAVTEEMATRMMAAKVAETEAKAKLMTADEVLRKVEAMYSALQAAQLLATVPGVAAAADEITASAGMEDLKPGGLMPPEVPPQGVPQEPTMQADMGIPMADPAMPPSPDSGLEGMQSGIETPTGADNVIPPLSP